VPFTLDESIYRITALVDPTPVVVVAYDDWLEGPVSLEPQKEVDATPFVGGGARTFARPNIFHQLSFRFWKAHANVALAAAFQYSHSIALKALAGVDFKIEILNHEGFVTLNKATVTAFPSDHVDRFTRFDITILGGAITSTLAPVEVLGLPGGSMLGLPDGSVLGLP
jgi:hypothetical protein